MIKDQNPEIIFKETTTRNALFCQFDDQNGIILLDVKNPFTAEDFEIVTSIIDPHFRERGELKGIIINAKKFPYWTSAQNRVQYLRFARENHQKFEKAALGMGGFFTKILARMASGRVNPEIKIFKYNEIEKAQEWILW